MKRNLGASLRDIGEDVRARPGRAGLSFLAIAVGMTALTVLLAVLGGLAERSRRIVGELGVNVFAVVAPGNPDESAASTASADSAATRRSAGRPSAGLRPGRHAHL
jgi:hypothetical protein